MSAFRQVSPRERMLAMLRREFGASPPVEAMAAVPRERFVPDQLRERAYDDGALPIGEGQTISQPYIVALMTEALQLQPGDRVLEVGTGSGYQAAVLARLAREVVTVERQTQLLERARRLLTDIGCTNVHAYKAGEVLGRPQDAPFDAIVVTAAAPHVPRVLLDQLADHGRMVLPIGTLRDQELVRVTKTSYGVTLARLGACRFVPLIGEGGFPSSPAEQQRDASRRIKLQ